MKIFLRKACGDCGLAELGRVERTWWMRLFPSVRHYYCRQCESTLLATKVLVDEHQWTNTRPGGGEKKAQA